MDSPQIHRHAFTSPLRYPGGKGALANFFKLIIEKNDLLDGHYVEVFAGGAGIAWPLLFGEYIQHVHINDIDKAIYAFWISVVDRTEELCRLILDTKVTMSEWNKQRAVQSQPKDRDPLELGFSTFFLNRTNKSGIITGGVIGGKHQSGRWKLNARFNKKDLIARIQRIARYRSRISLYDLDGKDFIRLQLPNIRARSLVYLDPPYYAKGKGLYQNDFRPEDHERIAQLIQRRIRQRWVVSYDAVPEIATLYKSRRELYYHLSYSAQARYSGKEIMLFSDNVNIPDVSHPVLSQRNRQVASGSR